LPDEMIDLIPQAFQYPRPGLVTLLLLINPLLPPLDDLRVRKALASGLDFDRVHQVVFHRSAVQPRGGLIPPGMMGHSPELGLPFDLAFARQCLAEAGFPGGKGIPMLKFGCYALDPGTKEIERQLKEHLGIELEHIVIPLGVLDQVPLHANMLMIGWVADYPDPDNFLRKSSVFIELSHWGWRQEHYYQLVEESAHSTDRLRRMALYRKADRILVNDQVLVVPIAYNNRTGLDLFRPSLGDIDISTIGALLYKHIKLNR
jgi:oligopeptide transport system substrate-binding protein